MLISINYQQKLYPQSIYVPIYYTWDCLQINRNSDFKLSTSGYNCGIVIQSKLFVVFKFFCKLFFENEPCMNNSLCCVIFQ